MSLREITLILLFQSKYKSFSWLYCSFCLSLRSGKYWKRLFVSIIPQKIGFKITEKIDEAAFLFWICTKMAVFELV